jgi:hypothetical protein
MAGLGFQSCVCKVFRHKLCRVRGVFRWKSTSSAHCSLSAPVKFSDTNLCRLCRVRGVFPWKSTSSAHCSPSAPVKFSDTTTLLQPSAASSPESGISLGKPELSRRGEGSLKGDSGSSKTGRPDALLTASNTWRFGSVKPASRIGFRDLLFFYLRITPKNFPECPLSVVWNWKIGRVTEKTAPPPSPFFRAG